MKKKYLAYCLALSMALTAAAPVAAAEPVDIVVEDDSEDTAVDFEESNEEAEEDTEEVEEDVDGADASDVETEAADFGDGEEAAPAVSEGDTTEDGWTSLVRESKISYKYDSQTQTLYFKASEPAAMPDNIQYGNTSEWWEAKEIVNTKKVVIGDNITSVGKMNFNNSESAQQLAYPQLEEVELSSSVKTIDDNAFGNVTTLKSINLEAVEKVGRSAFRNTGVENVTFKQDTVTFGGYSFSLCAALKSVTFTGTPVLEEHDFENCTQLNSFKCATLIPELGDHVFSGCSALESFDVPGVVEIGLYTFDKCSSLTQFNFSETEVIGGRAFRSSGIEKINFSKIKKISKKVFDQCTKLSAICFQGTKEEWDIIAETSQYPTEAVLHCKADTVEAKDATCTETGLKEVATCEVCGMHYSYQTDENVLPALGHDYEAEFTVDKAATCTEPGVQSKHCTRCDSRTEEQAIPAAGHKWTAWKKTTDATVNAAEKQARKCSVCGKEETKNVGTKLAPKMVVNATTVTLKVKQSTSGLKVTGLAKGDYVKSWKSTNAKVFTVSGKSNGTCKITGKKKGTAKLEITLASGLKKAVKVKVQTTAVRTTKISGLKKSVALKKGKRTTLKPVIAPFTSREKVTYRSSNKKVATVSSKGVVTAKKKGTAKITVRSGKKSYTVKITVK